MDGQVILWTDEEVRERLWLAFLAGFSDRTALLARDLGPSWMDMRADPDEREVRDAFEGWMRERAAVGL